MLSKQQLTFLRSLHQKKYRQMYGKFLVEGDKLVQELLLADIKIDTIYHLKGWRHSTASHKGLSSEVSEAELRKISTHENPNQVIAVAVMPDWLRPNQNEQLANGLYLACDNLGDPGNAGTIIRTAEWFGVKKIFFSESSVDIFNPKVVSSAKGSLFRIPVIYTKLESLFQQNRHLKVYGTFMDGDNIYNTNLDKNAIILIGNEANGIGAHLLPLIHQKLGIPSFGKAESLNAAIAAGIVLSEWGRRA